jgi:hypothetical protein
MKYKLDNHSPLQWFAFVLTLALISGTALAVDTAIPVTAGPLLEAVAIPYNDMHKAGIERKKYDTDCCHIFSAPGTPESERRYAPEHAFFVKVKIDARALASHILRESCEPKGFFSASRECDPEELSIKVSESLNRGQIGDLYGKYRAGFAAYTGDTRIRSTEKFGGFGIYQYQRNGDTDVLVVGPMPGKATTFVLTNDIGSISVNDFNPVQ